jgi:hypothetical protein
VTAIERLRDAFPELEAAPSQFHGEPALWLGGREIVHAHGADELEIRLTRKRIARLVDERVWQRSPQSDWLAVPAAEVELAVALVRDAIAANRVG